MSQEKKTRTRNVRSVREQQQPEVEPAAAAATSTEELKWLERAAFQVAFDHATDTDGRSNWQTRAYHEEADGRMVWPGIAGAALMAWMRERADLPAEIPMLSLPAAPADAQPPTDRSVEAPAAEDSAALRLTIDELSLKAVPAEQEVGGVVSDSRLDVRISFHLSGVAAYLATAHQSQYVVEMLAQDVSTNQVTILALKERQFDPELLEYSTAFSFEPPPIGEYQIVGLVLLPEQAVSATELGPALTVVAPASGATP